jgi:hypothetical protein
MSEVIIALLRTEFGHEGAGSRNSKKHGFGIDPPPKIESVPPDSLIQTSREIPIQPR